MIGMALERDAEHVVALALHPVGAAPDAGERRAPVVDGTGAHEHGESRVEVVHAADHLAPLFFPVDGGQEIEEAAAEGLAREAAERLPPVDCQRDREALTIHGRLQTELLTYSAGGVDSGE